MSVKILWVQISNSGINNDVPSYIIAVGPSVESVTEDYPPVPDSEDILPPTIRRALAEWLDT